MKFELISDYAPMGDQPEAIAQLVEGINNGTPAQTLLGVTGSGKTFTMANVIKEINRPTLILSHNKTLAAQLYGEFKEYGLYIFCKDNLTDEEVKLTMEYASELQRHLDIRYSKMYLSLIDRLYVCDLSDVDRTEHHTTCGNLSCRHKDLYLRTDAGQEKDNRMQVPVL